MGFRKVTLERAPSMEEVLSISKSGLYFGAEFIKNNNLDKKVSVSFFLDDEDIYKVGFEFYDDPGKENSLILINTSSKGVGYGRTVRATEFISKNKILQAIQSDPIKANRLFPLKKERNSEIFYVLLRPSFEYRVNYEKRNSIDDDLTGIYRYIDKTNRVLYIGKGVIKARSNSPERKDWGVTTIEYSVLRTEEECFKWETFYLDSYRTVHGALPVYNRISGQDTNR